MSVRQWGLLIRWFMVFTAYAGAGALLPACGPMTRSEAGNLQISLAIPEGEDPTLFWLGADRRELRVLSPGGGERTIPWVPGNEMDLELRKGDRISFQAFDRDGRLLITGALTLDGEKKVSIPLHRDL